MNRRLLNSILFFFLMAFSLNAQENTTDMADVMRSSGKIYVVIGVIAIIFICIVVLMLLIERKLARLEKEIKENKH